MSPVVFPRKFEFELEAVELSECAVHTLLSQLVFLLLYHISCRGISSR